MYICPRKRNVDALLKVGVIIKVVVFRTLCCVVAAIALATDCCCCCWSIHRVHRQLTDDSIISYSDLLENAVSFARNSPMIQNNRDVLDNISWKPTI